MRWIMAKVKVTKKTTTKTRTKKIPEGNVQCNMCSGRGYYKKPKRK